ncbi:hypothetical protein P8452_01935 [Trifolium repens]|nr:hypothetical protein P8452_01935 [Trifolium repens]
MEQQQQHHARKLTLMEVTLEPWSHNNDGDQVDTKVQSVIVPQEIYGPTKKDEPITSKRSTRIKKTPNWMKDCVMF